MKNEYNDYQIFSPEKMEAIAKAYQNNHINKVQQNANTLELLSVPLELFISVKFNMDYISSLCQKNTRYRTKCKQIKKITILIDKQIVLLNSKTTHKTPNNISPNNYCDCITHSIRSICEAQNKLINIERTLLQSNINNQDYNLIQLTPCILDCLYIIKELSLLIGECKYRRF